MGGETALGARPMVSVALFFLGGVLVGPNVGLGAPGLFLVAVALAGLVFWRRRRVGAFLTALVALWFLGAAVAQLNRQVSVPPVGRRVELEGVVEQVRVFDAGRSLTIRVSTVDGAPVTFRALLSGTGPQRLIEGQRIGVATKLKPVAPALNPAEVDRFEYQQRRGAVVHGSFDADTLVILEPASSLSHWLHDTHEAMRRAAEHVSDDRESVALFLTLAAGERSMLGDEWETIFARSGLAHVLSVSGLHVAVLALALFQLIRWLLTRRQSGLFRRLDAQRVSAVLSLPAVWAFVWFTGSQAPAVRSAVMVTVLLAGMVSRRRSDSLTALAIAACLMGTVQPWSLFDLSVQLSFLSVIALVLLAPPLREALPIASPDFSVLTGWRLRLMKWREAVLTTFTSSAAVTLASAPLLALVFQRLSIVGLLSNVLMLPICGLLTLIAAASAAVFSVSQSLAQPLLWAGVQLSKLVVSGAAIFSALPGAGVEVAAPGLAACLLWWLGLLTIVALSTRWRWLGLLGPAVAACMPLISVTNSNAPLQVTFLSVGHGDAIVVSAGDHHAIIDGGGVPNGADVGTRILLPFLKQHRITHFDFAVLTHPHPDHALGLISILKQVPTDALWLPDDFEGGPLVDELIDAIGPASVRQVSKQSRPTHLNGALVEVLGPPPAEQQLLLESENDRSVVLRLSLGDTSFLLTGDIEAAGEEALANLRRAPAEQVILKVPHHGSRTSSTEQFVKSVAPQFAVFSVGRDNRFHFPHHEIVQRYQAAGARVLRTDLDGAITVSTDGHTVEVTPFR